MKRTTKIKSALATAVLCSLMTTAYAAENYRPQVDLTIKGSQTTISDDSFPRATDDYTGLGSIPKMHYVGRDDVYAKNSDGTYSKYGEAYGIHTNGRPLMTNMLLNIPMNKDVGKQQATKNQYWGVTDGYNTIVSLREITNMGLYGNLRAKFYSLTVMENGVAKTMRFPWNDTNTNRINQAIREIITADSNKHSDLRNVTLQDFKDAIQKVIDSDEMTAAGQITDQGITYTKAELEALMNNLVGAELECDGANYTQTAERANEDEMLYSYKGIKVTEGSEWSPMDYSSPIKLVMEVPDTLDKVVTGTFKYDENGFAGGDVYEYKTGEMAPAAGFELKHQYVTVENLVTENNTIVNMTKVNTIGDNPRVQTIDDPEQLRRFLYAEEANVGNNTTFKVGIYGYTGEENGLKTGGVADMIMLKKLNNEGTGVDERETINIALGYVPEIKDLTAKSGEVLLHEGKNGQSAKATHVLAYCYSGDGMKIKVQGVESQADGVFDSYTITPVIAKQNNDVMAYYVKSYTYEKNGTAENVKALADFHVTGDKVVRLQQDSFFRNAGGRELIDRHQNDVEHDNNVWADYYHGKVSSSSTYGRHISQSYNGYQVGYDTLMVPNYKNGNIYVGAYLSKIDSDSTIASGKGELDSVGFGLYGTWAGNRGHYIDGVISVNDLDNEFNYANDIDGKVNGDYSHRYYTAAAQYGYRKHYDNGFFVEPKLSMSIGYGEGAEYQLSNGINAKMDDYKNIIGKAGAYVGKEFGNKGNVYVGAFYAHNYAKDMKGVLSYESSGKTATKDLDVVDLEDTWYEFNIGAKYALSPVSNIAVDYIKQTGSDIGNDWSLNCTYQFMF